MSDDEIAERRRHPAPAKGVTREQNTAHTVGYDPVEADGDQVVVSTPPVRTIQEAAPAREVAEDIYGMVWKWAQGSRENFAVMAKIVRAAEPAAYGHLSDDELATKIETHARDASRKATEKLYRDKWDKGNNADQWQGKAAMP